jgi:very-short-patch-repair endonuclease
MNAVEREIGRIAGEQDNVITVRQAIAAGLGRGAIAARCRTGRMQRLHQNVLLIGPAPPSFSALARAATMAVGAGCAVALDPASVLLRLRPEPSPERRAIDIIVDSRNVRSRPGITIHRSTLVVAEFGYVRGIPVTSPARTIADLAAVENIAQVEQLLIDGRQLRCVSDRELFAVIDRVPHRHGHGALRALLQDETDEGYSRSRAERRLRKLIRDAGLPRAIHNGPKVQGFLIDAHWPALKVVVEVDGRKYHDHPWAFERDHYRDQVLVSAGYAVLRVTWRQLCNDPIGVAVRIAQTLLRAELAA